MGYLYDKLHAHNDRCRFLSAIHVPPVPIPTDFYTPTKLEILETQFFTTHIWYIVYYNSSKHIGVYRDLIAMWYTCSDSLVSPRFDVSICLLPRSCGRRKMYLDKFRGLLIDIRQQCDADSAQVPYYISHTPINIYDTTSDWVSAVRDAIRSSLNISSPIITSVYVATYAIHHPMRDLVKGNIIDMMNFNYRRWKYKDIKAWNLRWEDNELMFYQGSIIYGYMQKCIAVRNW